MSLLRVRASLLAASSFTLVVLGGSPSGDGLTLREAQASPPAEPASVTIDPSHVTHALPDAFFGVGFGGYFHEDAGRADYLALVKALAPEIIRLHMYSRTPGTVAAPSAEMSDHLRMAEALVPGGTKILMQLGAAPKSSSLPVTDVDNVDDGARGPANHGAWVAELQRRFPGALLAVESYNEPATNTGAWYPDARECADWATVHQRAYQAEVKKALPSVHDYGAVLATTSNRYGETEMKRFLYGEIPGWPFSDDNLAHLDVVSFHGYQSATAVGGGPTLDFQAEVNRAFYPKYDPDRGGFLAAATAYRALLDARGATTKPLAMTEFGTFGTAGKTSRGALMDAAFAVLAAREGGRLRLEQLSFHAVNRNLVLADGSDAPGGGGDSIVLYGPDHAFHASVRYTVLKEIVGPFLHRYKRQVSTSVVASPTPPTSVGNAVPSVQAAAGLSADGRTLGVLVLNVDLATARDVSITLPAAPVGDVTGKTMPAGQPFDAPLPVVAPFHAGASFERTIGPGELELYEIPLVAAATDDAGPADVGDAGVAGDGSTDAGEGSGAHADAGSAHADSGDDPDVGQVGEPGQSSLGGCSIDRTPTANGAAPFVASNLAALVGLALGTARRRRARPVQR